MKKAQINIFVNLIFCLFLIGIPAQAQRTSARATINPAEIAIGEQAVIDLEIIAPKGRTIISPVYPDTLVKGIEVLKMMPPDTTINHEVMTIHQKYIVTSFDSTLYHVPFMQVVDGKDTIKSNSFGLKVSSVVLSEQVLAQLEQMKKQENDSIDFDALQLADIKPNIKPPFVWQDYLQYLWIIGLILLVLAIIGIGIYFALRKKNKGYYFKPEIILPPHAVALKALDQIKSDKIWQHGLEKQYYTALTDTLREYIEKRFMINAFEKTSDEILSAMKVQTEADSSMDNLRQILKLSDLVKFAKYKPLANENDLSLVNAYLFVNQTKIEPKPIEGENVNGEQNNNPEQGNVGQKEANS